jgi:hypothetical protein
VLDDPDNRDRYPVKQGCPANETFPEMRRDQFRELMPELSLFQATGEGEQSDMEDDHSRF